MRALHLLASGGYGGIGSLMRSYGKESKLVYLFLFGELVTYMTTCTSKA